MTVTELIIEVILRTENHHPNLKRTLNKKCPYSELFWSAFSRIRPEYLRIQSECGKILARITPNTYSFYRLRTSDKSLLKINPEIKLDHFKS